jgi:hypothetical protein
MPVSQTFEFFDTRARAAQAEAEQSTLTNVRDRALRSAQAWREMADRQRLVDAGRVKAEAYRAERIAAERAAADAFEA